MRDWVWISRVHIKAKCLQSQHWWVKDRSSLARRFSRNWKWCETLSQKSWYQEQLKKTSNSDFWSTHTHAWACTCVYTQRCTQSWARSHVHTCTHRHAHACTHAHRNKGHSIFMFLNTDMLLFPAECPFVSSTKLITLWQRSNMFLNKPCPVCKHTSVFLHTGATQDPAWQEEKVGSCVSLSMERPTQSIL